MQASQDHKNGRVDTLRWVQSSRQDEQSGLELLPAAPAPCTTKNSFLLRLESTGDAATGKDGTERAAARSKPCKDPDGTAHSAIIITTPSDSSSNDGSSPVSIYDVLSRKRKYAIIYISAVAAILAPLSTTMYLPALRPIQADLHTTIELVVSSVAIYMFVIGAGALLWGPLSDWLGRRAAFLAATLLFLATSVPCIFAPSIYLLIVFRALQGLAVAAYGSVGSGLAADIFAPCERGTALGISSVPPLVGPVIGPLLGGVLSDHFGWRSTFIFTTCMAGVVILPLLLFFLPETTQYRALRRLRATDPQTAAVIKEADSIEASPPRFRAPWYPVLLILDRQLILHVALGLVAFGSYYCSVTELPINLGSPAYGLSPSKVGLCYLPIGVAGMLACPLGGKVSDICGRVNSSQPLRKVLPSNWMLLFVFPPCLLLYGWSLHFHMHIAVPLIGIFLVALATCSYLPGIFSYMTAVKQQTAGAAAAGLYALLFLASGVLMLVAASVIEAVGIGPFSTILAGLNVIVASVACVQIRRGIATAPVEQQQQQQQQQQQATAGGSSLCRAIKC
ncbi:hypothetical protein OEZ85_006476 [Tetradesmus obliquus]|uniref:Major facilitator superfamily (MFS) profile domain-containing protein n=1 Tax=Tetradesmus obliquus TaxID=3088 RepID=A0ABY8TUR2_TETOB|nr:hypothetical protein OEZ85_006476 [Tetradesmus obliquus]